MIEDLPVNTEKVHVKTTTLVILTSLFFSIGPLTVDFSLPGLASIQNEIGTHSLHAELTLTAIFLGMFVGQFVFGAIADRYGRRWPLLVSLSVYTLAAVAAALSTTLLTFGVFRLCQALGYGVAIVLGRSIAVDACNERDTAKVFSTAITVMSLTSVLAPAAGGLLLDHFGWRAIFVAMALVGASSVAAVAIWLPETLPPGRRSSVGFSRVIATYGALLRNSRFTTFALTGACAVACQFTYNTAAPSVLIEHFSLTPAVCGFLLSAIALSMAIASQLNAFLLKWYSPDNIILYAVTAAVAAAIGLLFVVFTGTGGVIGLTVALFALVATIGFIAGNAMAAAISSAGAQAGAASALLGVMQFLLGTLGSAAVGIVHDSSGRVMGSVIALLAVVGLITAARSRPAKGSARLPRGRPGAI